MYGIICVLLEIGKYYLHNKKCIQQERKSVLKLKFVEFLFNILYVFTQERKT